MAVIRSGEGPGGGLISVKSSYFWNILKFDFYAATKPVIY